MAACCMLLPTICLFARAWARTRGGRLACGQVSAAASLLLAGAPPAACTGHVATQTSTLGCTHDGLPRPALHAARMWPRCTRQRCTSCQRCWRITPHGRRTPMMPTSSSSPPSPRTPSVRRPAPTLTLTLTVHSARRTWHAGDIQQARRGAVASAKLQLPSEASPPCSRQPLIPAAQCSATRAAKHAVARTGERASVHSLPHTHAHPHPPRSACRRA